MKTLPKMLAMGAAAFMACAAATFPAQASVEYEEPRNEAQRITLIDQLIDDKEWREALKHIAIALKENPQNAQLKFKRAVVYTRMGDKPTAKRLFREFIDRYPEVVEPYNNLAAIYASEGNLEAARDLLTQAVTINPNFALGYENLGDLALEGKRPDKRAALRYYEKALSLTPKDRRLTRKVENFKKQLQK